MLHILYIYISTFWFEFAYRREEFASQLNLQFCFSLRIENIQQPAVYHGSLTYC